MQDPVAPLCLCPLGTVPVPAPVPRGPLGGAGPCLPLSGPGGSSPRLRQHGPGCCPCLVLFFKWSCLLYPLPQFPPSCHSLPHWGMGGAALWPWGQGMECEQGME